MKPGQLFMARDGQRFLMTSSGPARVITIHEPANAGRGVRQCCRKHGRADIEAAFREAAKRVRPLVERERQVEHVPPETMAMVLR